MSNIDMSLTEAIENLTVGEVRAIETHLGKSLDGGKLSGTDLTTAVVWAYERRNDLKGNSGKRTDWHDLDQYTLKQLGSYFASEEIEIDPAEPETEQGKDN